LSQPKYISDRYKSLYYIALQVRKAEK